MLYLEIAAEIVVLFAFFFGAIKLWRKGKPLYFQIIICAIGCFALYYLAVIVLLFCDVTETYYNNSFLGFFGCNLFLFCANRGAIDKMFDKPKTIFIVVSILAGIIMFALSIVVGIFYFGVTKAAFYIFVIMEVPACFVVYFNVKHLFTPKDELGLIKGLRFTDITTLILCILCLASIALWINESIVSGVGDFITSLAALALSVAAVKGAEKWSF